jgi:hypothetical protein
MAEQVKGRHMTTPRRLPPEALAMTAYLSHLDHCDQCHPRFEPGSVSRARAVMVYDPCPFGARLAEAWEAEQAEVERTGSRNPQTR